VNLSSVNIHWSTSCWGYLGDIGIECHLPTPALYNRDQNTLQFHVNGECRWMSAHSPLISYLARRNDL
jgi:hypothetical protein